MILEVKENTGVNSLNLTVDPTVGSICTKLDKEGIKTNTFDLF